MNFGVSEMAAPTRPARPKTPKQKPKPAGSPVSGDYADAFPNSQKVYVEGPAGIRVPMREIVLSGGEPPLRVYDTSGPQGIDVRVGLPSLRDEWICQRDAQSVPHPEAAFAVQGSTPGSTGVQRG